MKRQPVKSSDLRSVGYDQNTNTLEIEFCNGSIYQYFDVPESEYIAIMAAKSKGKYFHKHIKSNYKYKQIKRGG